MHEPSPLSLGLRELIAAYTSYINECEFCTKSHIAIAAELLGSEDLVWSALRDLEGSSLSEKEKALDSVVPIGWPPLKETLEKIVAAKIPVVALRCVQSCARHHRRRRDAVGFKFGNSTIFVGLVEWADRIVTEQCRQALR